jgi:hypothetical protein
MGRQGWTEAAMVKLTVTAPIVLGLYLTALALTMGLVAYVVSWTLLPSLPEGPVRLAAAVAIAVTLGSCASFVVASFLNHQLSRSADRQL